MVRAPARGLFTALGISRLLVGAAWIIAATMLLGYGGIGIVVSRAGFASQAAAIRRWLDNTYDGALPSYVRNTR